MKPIDHIVGAIIWLFLGPVLAQLLWQISVSALPDPGPFLGTIITVLVTAGISAVPFLLLRSARQTNHTAGAILAALALCWSFLATLGLFTFGLATVEIAALQYAIR